MKIAQEDLVYLIEELRLIVPKESDDYKVLADIAERYHLGHLVSTGSGL